MNEYILAYDLGTSGVKAAIVDFEGRLLCYREEEYPLYAPMVGYGEQSTDDYWDAICKATRAAIAELDRFVRIEKTFYPDPERVAIYNEKYETWKKLYPALKDLFAEMADQQ